MSRPAEVAALMKGAIDMHCHCEPLPHRRWDLLALSQSANQHGMRAIVLKNRWGSSYDLAYFVNKITKGVEMIGMIVLNRWIGGLNPSNVKDFVDLGVKVVCMPTRHAMHYLKWAKLPTEDGIEVTKNDELMSEAKEILGIVADNNAVLYTGHISPEESVLVAREAKNLGASVVVTHAQFAYTKASMEQMIEMGELGAHIEHVAVLATEYSYTNHHAYLHIQELAAIIAEIGAEHCVVSSDHGQTANPPAPDALRNFVYGLLDAGVEHTSIDCMIRTNPEKLLKSALDRNEERAH